MIDKSVGKCIERWYFYRSGLYVDIRRKLSNDREICHDEMTTIFLPQIA